MILRSALLITSLSITAACAVDVEDEPSTNETESAIVEWRNDQTAVITVGTGFWGGWTQALYCNEGMFATGYRMRVEQYRGAGRTPDDTALNAVELQCASRDFARSESVLPHEGLWGDWGDAAYCPYDGFLRGARMRIESPRGGGTDDTAANDVEFSCTNGGVAQATNGTTWGSWNDWTSCGEGTAVCGISVRFEGNQGSGNRNDDTALNGIELMCCQL